MSESAKSAFDWSHLYHEEKYLDQPITLKATVIRGFQRGSKELGIPTANLNMEQLGSIGENLATGVYFGISYLEGSSYQSVVSVGWNPFYKNEKKTVEAHLLAVLDDFYGKNLELTLIGYLRNEANFNSLDELISCINSDISISKRKLASYGDLTNNSSSLKSYL